MENIIAKHVNIIALLNPKTKNVKERDVTGGVLFAFRIKDVVV